MSDNPKRKRKGQPFESPTPFNGGAFTFITPLSIEECAKRLKKQGRFDESSGTLQIAHVVRINADTYSFNIDKDIDKNLDSVVEVVGELQRLEDNDTFVMGRPKQFGQLKLSPAVFVFLLAILPMIFLKTPRSSSGLHPVLMLIGSAIAVALLLTLLGMIDQYLMGRAIYKSLRDDVLKRKNDEGL